MALWCFFAPFPLLILIHAQGLAHPKRSLLGIEWGLFYFSIFSPSPKRIQSPSSGGSSLSFLFISSTSVETPFFRNSIFRETSSSVCIYPPHLVCVIKKHVMVSLGVPLLIVFSPIQLPLLLVLAQPGIDISGKLVFRTKIVKKINLFLCLPKMVLVFRTKKVPIF